MKTLQKPSSNASHTGPAARPNASAQANYDTIDLIEDLPVAIYICDKEGRITFFNHAAAQLWGREPEIGKELWCGSWKIYNTDGTLLALDECPMSITLKEGFALKGKEVIVERPDGVRINVLPHPKPIFDADGNIVGAVNMLIDITEKRSNEQYLKELSHSLEAKVAERTLTLKKSEERYHKMIDEVQEYAILLLDINGNILNWNKGAQRIKGYTEKEIIGKNFRIFYLPEDREAGVPEKLIKQATEKGKAALEGWRLRKNGEQFWGSIVITALHDEQGNIIGFSKVTRDLTAMKKANDQKIQYAKELEFRNKELEQFAFIASHDLQEPLRKIKTFAILSQKSYPNEELAKSYIDKISSAATRMSGLIKDVLAYSQLTYFDEVFKPTDLNAVLDNVLTDFELLIQERHATITNTPLPAINGIPFQLEQLFGNLISNSIKFSNDDPLIEISSEIIINGEVKKHPLLNPAMRYLKITYTDNGIGFEPKYADQVFKLFQRLNSIEYGNGIGLALCKKIVENHNGQITATSELNKGTTFTIFLPL